jgi:hypothetical protein
MVNPFDNFGEVASGTKRSIADDLALQGYNLVCSLCDSQRVIAQSLGSRVPFLGGAGRWRQQFEAAKL